MDIVVSQAHGRVPVTVFQITGAIISDEPLVAKAQQAEKMPRVGVLAGAAGQAGVLKSFYQGLRDRGWVDGQNIRIELRQHDGREEQFPAFAAELVREHVTVIVAAGGPASLNQPETRRIPSL